MFMLSTSAALYIASVFHLSSICRSQHNITHIELCEPRTHGHRRKPAAHAMLCRPQCCRSVGRSVRRSDGRSGACACVLAHADYYHYYVQTITYYMSSSTFVRIYRTHMCVCVCDFCTKLVMYENNIQNRRRVVSDHRPTRCRRRPTRRSEWYDIHVIVHVWFGGDESRRARVIVSPQSRY